MSAGDEGSAPGPSPPAVTAIYAFGDSYSDAGNQWLSTDGLEPVSPPYSDGRWSNGAVWVQDLAVHDGLPALTPSQQDGTDFAHGGAETGSPALAGTGFDLPSQLAAFEAQVTAPAAGALYTLDIGINDLLAILKTGDDVAAATPLVEQSVQAEAAFVASLVGAGAADVLVLNVPDLGTTPFEVESGAPAAAEATALSRVYDTALQTALATVAGAAAVHVVDAFALFDSVVADPGAFGLTDAIDPVWTGNGSDSTSGTLRTTVPAAQNQYFFWDIVHPTAAGQSLIAAAAEQVLDTAPCFAAGTRILTARGEVPVEHLAVGELVRTRAGRAARVRWLGHRRIDALRHPRPWDVCPVRVHAGAFGDAQPHRDLLLSPDHAILCDGVLVPVRCLVNGATVVREPAGPVTYWHVELDRHDIVVAEGLACESFLDTGNRGAFENGGAVAQLHPDFALGVWQRQGCVPLCRDGAEVTAARRHLLARALALGHALTGDPALRLVADGKALPPPQIDGARHRFAVRRRARGVRLLSRSGVPSDVDPAAIDARRLGVRVERIAVFAPWRWHDLPLPAIPDGSGWHALEAGSGRRWRWTDGDACLPIPREVAGCGILLIDVHIGAAQPSWLKRRPTSHRRNTP